MREYVFNERKKSEQVIEGGFVDTANIGNTIRLLARYNYYVLKLSADESYKQIDDYMRKYCDYYSEVEYYKTIDGCIRDAKRGSWKNIDSVAITKEELSTIATLNDLKKEKLAFVLLADAKYNNACGDFKSNRSYLSLSDLFNQARVAMPAKDRFDFIKFLFYEHMVATDESEYWKNGKKLNYISDDDADVELLLDENNYKELAFTYLNWKRGGYKPCKSCGRLIKIKKNTQYCKYCTDKSDRPKEKRIICAECGTVVYINIKDTQTTLCPSCREKHKKQLKSEQNRRYYERKKQI